MIPYSRQQITDSDIAVVVSALKDDILTGGDKVGEFEQAIAKYIGVKHVVAMNSATSALHVAYLALGVREGGEVVTTPITFAATANAALMAGAEVKFAPVKFDGNITPDTVYMNSHLGILCDQLVKQSEKALKEAMTEVSFQTISTSDIRPSVVPVDRRKAAIKYGILGFVVGIIAAEIMVALTVLRRNNSA